MLKNMYSMLKLLCGQIFKNRHKKWIKETEQKIIRKFIVFDSHEHPKNAHICMITHA